MAIVAALAPDKPPAAEETTSAAVAPTSRRASRRLNWEEQFAIISSPSLAPTDPALLMAKIAPAEGLQTSCSYQARSAWMTGIVDDWDNDD
jgi:hypothetical protein